MEGGFGELKPGAAGEAKIWSQATRQQNMLELALYKVMSSECVGVGQVHRFILIHSWPCQRGEGCWVCLSQDHCHTLDKTGHFSRQTHYWQQKHSEKRQVWGRVWPFNLHDQTGLLLPCAECSLHLFFSCCLRTARIAPVSDVIVFTALQEGLDLVLMSLLIMRIVQIAYHFPLSIFLIIFCMKKSM